MFQAAAGARVTIDGSLTVNGAYTTWQDIEITYSGWTTRETELEGSTPADLPITKKLDVLGDAVLFVNCNIHDLATVGVWTGADASTFYGCNVFHIGWNGPDRGHGHAVYTQNSTPERTFKHNTFHNCFGWGIHAYTGSGAIDNLTFIENTCFEAGAPAGWDTNNILVGGGPSATNPKLYRNNTYGAGGVNIGYNEGGGATGVVLEDNYFPDGLVKVACTIASESGNVTEAPASGSRVTVYANEYETGRALITVYNWDAADSIAVDVSAVLSAGAAYALHNTQDFYGDIATGTVAQDGTITVDMRAVSHTVAAVAGGWPSEATTFPVFGCLILRAG